MPFFNSHVNLLFGKPMSGKGLMGRLMSDIWGFVPFVARDMIQQAKQQDPDFKIRAERVETAGNLLDDTTICDLVWKRFNPSIRQFNNMDGLPRTVKQAVEVLKLLKRYQVEQITLVHLSITDHDSIERFKQKSDADDRTGRLDARLETHIDRLAIHNEHQGPVLSYLATEGVKIVTVSAIAHPWTILDTIQARLELPTHHNQRDVVQKKYPHLFAA